MAAVRNRWKAAVSAARRDEGVADPAIVMITIVVLIVLGLTGLYFGRGFVEQARDTNAQSDLSRIAASQEFYASSANAYTDDIEVLQQGRVAFSLSTGVEVRLAANEYGWLARSSRGRGSSSCPGRAGRRRTPQRARWPPPPSGAQGAAGPRSCSTPTRRTCHRSSHQPGRRRTRG